MTYRIELKPRAIRDLKAIDKSQARRITDKIGLMKADLAGDVKRLTKSTPEFRLRVGDYRILFEVEGDKVIVYRVRHRKDPYGGPCNNMIELHPEILEKDGKKEFVILTYEEFAAIQQALAGAEDLATLRAAKKDDHDAPTVPLEQVVDELAFSS